MAPRDDGAEDLATLMGRAQQGDAEAYNALLRAVATRVRRLVRARRRFWQDADIEDVVQDVLLSVHSARATYDPARPFEPWLTAILRHRLADAARRYAKLGQREDIVEDLDVTFAASDTNPLEELEGREALKNALSSLPPGQRQAVELLKLKEMSLKEASAQTGLSVGALKLATHRAMASLRRHVRRLRSNDED